MKTSRIHQAVAIALSLSLTFFSVPVFAAEPVIDPVTGTATPTVDPTADTTSTNTSTAKIKNKTQTSIESLSVNNTLTATTPPVVDVVSVVENTVAEGRANLDDFMALLASKGITNISREEMESLKPTGTGSFSGTHLVSKSGDQVAVAVSGEVSHYTCTIVSGNIQSCIPTSKVSYSKTLYKPDLNSKGVVITNSELTDIRTGFTSEGELVSIDRNFNIRIYNEDGTTKAYARKAILINSVPSFTNDLVANPSAVSPDGTRLVTAEGGYLVLRDQQGTELGRIVVQAQQAYTYAFSVTNLGVYYTGNQRGNTFLSFVPFDNFRESAAQNVASRLPAEVKFSSGSTVTFVGSGVADIRGSDFVTRRVDLEQEPSVPEGWTRVESNPHYAFRKTANSYGNYEAHLLNLLTNQDMIVGFGSISRHDPFLVDVDKDGKVALVAFHESGPIVGQFSWVELHRLADLTQDPQNGYKKAEKTIPGVYQSHQFQNDRVIVNVEVYDTATPDPNDTRIQTVTTRLKTLLGQPKPKKDKSEKAAK